MPSHPTRLQKDHDDPWSLIASVIAEGDDYLDELEAGLAAMKKRQRLEGHPVNAQRLYPSTFATAENLRAANTRFWRSLERVRSVGERR